MGHLFRTFFYTIPKLAGVLQPIRFLGFIKCLLALWWFVVSRKLVKNLSDYRIQFAYLGQPFTLYLRYPMDIGVLREIYIDEEYMWCPAQNPRVIVDLGAHYGDTAVFYHLRFPDAKIIAVEPSPENFERLVKNVAQIPAIVPIQAAVGDADGVVDLVVGGSSLGYSTVKNQGREKVVSVTQITLASLLKQQGIEKADLIKFDIEGAEFIVFSVPNVTSLSHAFIGEVHTDLVPSCTLNSFLEYFNAAKIEITEIAGRGRFLVRIQ